jgi:formylglycine-generating enzyme required for sulfatase activity
MDDAWSSFRKSTYSLVIGIGTYRDESFRDLRSAQEDASKLLAVLTRGDKCGVPPGNTEVLAGEVDREAVLAALDRLSARATGAHVVLLYFAGHGIKGPRGTNYLCLSDTQRDDLDRTAISEGQLQNLLAAFTARRVVVVLDCCGSGAFGEASRDYLRARGDAQARVILASSARGESAHEDSSSKHGAFTYHLIRALSGQTNLTRKDGVLWLDELWDYLSRMVWTEVLASHDERQTPVKLCAVTEGRTPLAALAGAQGAPPESERDVVRKIVKRRTRALRLTFAGLLFLAFAYYLLAPLALGGVMLNKRIHTERRKSAATWLGRIGWEFLAVGYLGRGVSDPDADEGVALACIHALRDRGGRRCRGKLLDLLVTEDVPSVGPYLQEIGKALAHNAWELPHQELAAVVEQLIGYMETEDRRKVWSGVVALQQFRGWNAQWPDPGERDEESTSIADKERFVEERADKAMRELMARSGEKCIQHPHLPSLTFVYVPGGSFRLGWDRALEHHNPGIDADLEKETVYDGKTVGMHVDGFWIGVCEVTRGEFGRFVRERGYQMRDANGFPIEDVPGWPDPTREEVWKSDWPISYVNWRAAHDFSQWVGARLPTEVEWEKAAKWDPDAKCQRVWPWGNDTGEGRANCDNRVTDEEWTNEEWTDYRNFTSPARSFIEGASPYGCLNMAGNVWEWCYDWYLEDAYYRSDRANLVIPNELQGRPHHVIRGGAYTWGWREARCTHRAHSPASQYTSDTGFRCAL